MINIDNLFDSQNKDILDQLVANSDMLLTKRNSANLNKASLPAAPTTYQGMPKYKSKFGDESLFDQYDYFANIIFQPLLDDIQDAVKNNKGLLQYNYTKYQVDYSQLIAGFPPLPTDRKSVSDDVNWIDSTIKKILQSPTIPLSPPATKDPSDFEDTNTNQWFKYSGALSTRPGVVAINTSACVFFSLDFQNKQVQFSITFYFQDDSNIPAMTIITDNLPGYLELYQLVHLSPSSEAIDYMTAEFKDAFQKTKDPDTIAWLYDVIPPFVATKFSDDVLDSHLKILASNSSPDSTAVLNLLAAAQNYSLWGNYINTDPSAVRMLFDNFDSDYISQLIYTFMKMGSGFWTDEDYKNADQAPYIFDENTLNIDDQSSIVYTGYSTYKEDSKKYEIGAVVQLFEKGTLASSQTTVKVYGTVAPFAPVKTTVNNKDIYLPAFVTEYFTNNKIEDSRKKAINLALALIVPEDFIPEATDATELSKSLEDGLKESLDEDTFTPEELDWMASRKIGNLGGNILKDTQIRQLRGLLNQKDILLIVEGDIKAVTRLYKPIGKFQNLEDLFFDMNVRGRVGGFDATTGQFFLTKNATEIVAFHEMSHFKQFEELGVETYNELNKLDKEMYVWKQINSQRNRWTEAEFQDALEYINDIRNDFKLDPIKLK